MVHNRIGGHSGLVTVNAYTANVVVANRIMLQTTVLGAHVPLRSLYLIQILGTRSICRETLDESTETEFFFLCQSSTTL